MASFSSNTLALYLFALFLTGCAAFKTQDGDNVTIAKADILHDQHMALVNSIAHFSLTGRLGVTTDAKGFSGRVAWQHKSDGDNIDIFSPIGGKVANISKTDVEIMLTNSKNEAITAPDAETLTEQSLGFKLPLSGLSYWALGRPNKTGLVDYMTWDDEGRIQHLQQDRWDIHYQDYQEFSHGYFLPRKITLRSNELLLKLIIEKWSDIESR
jgi:outer membrane lipoprotein LolB